MSTAREVDTASPEPFLEWQRAVAALKAAEARGAEHAEIVRLSTEVIRTRNEVTVDRLQAGWDPPDVVLQKLSVDDQLLREKDDAALPTSSLSAVPAQRQEQ